MQRKRAALIISILLLGGLGGVTWSEQGRGWLRVVRQDWLSHEPVVAGLPRRVMDCPQGPGKRRLVALTFGQSNAANYVQDRHTPTEGVLNYFAGQCYAGADPLPGATGTGGSVWSRLGDALIASGHYDAVVIAGVAVSATDIARWSVGGDLHKRLLDVLADMRARDLTPTHLLWHQGETDAKLQTTADAYRRSFLAMVRGIRAMGITAPVYVARATYCHGRSSAEILAAQSSLVDSGLGIREGPDTDSMRGRPWRYDDCHFSAAGAARHAELWRDALLTSTRRP